MSPREFFDLVDNWDFYKYKLMELQGRELTKAEEADLYRYQIVVMGCEIAIHDEVVRVRKILDQSSKINNQEKN